MNPKCNTCQTISIVVNAGMLGDIPYFYCRKCKEEVNEYGELVTGKPVEHEQQEVATETTTKKDSHSEYEELLTDHYPYWL